VLLALGGTPDEAHASVRFSLGEETTEADVDTVVAIVPEAIQALRALAGSPASSGVAGV
jgi:cysteine desulfurase